MISIKKHTYLIFCLSLVLFASCKEETVLNDTKLAEFSESVNPDDIRHHIAVLADDSLKGRLPGTSEYKQAMAYVENRFKEFGITPIGDKERSTYYQTLELRNSVVDNKQSYMILNDMDSLQVGEDYFFTGNANEILNEFSGDLVFAGFGVQAIEFGHNDFENLDVKGKIVAILGGAPSSLPASERAYFGNTNTKIETLDNLGAEGILFVPAPGGRGTFKGSYDRMAQRGVNSVVMPDGKALGRSNFGNMKFGGALNWGTFSKIANITKDDIENYSNNGIKIKQFDKSITLSGKVISKLKQFESANVLGLLEGNELKDEYIVHTAHLDHVGIGRPIDGDSIYNGAHDNASGISAMIEIARLYSKLPSKPKRSVIFAAVTAEEEMGLLGSKYLAVNPPVDQDKIIANVNTDMPTLIAPILSVEPLGAEQSSIMGVVERATKQLNLRIDPDHMPEQVRFVRSDNLNFVLEGIPALRMKYGLKTETSETGLDSIINEFTRKHYHKPSDELNDDLFNFDAARTYVRLQFMNSYLINVSEEKPTWNKDSFFRKFKKNDK